MHPLEKLHNIKFSKEEKDRYIQVFKETLEKIKLNSIDLTQKKTKHKDYYLIIEPDRLNSIFVHIVPLSLYDLFNSLKENLKDQFLGFSILVKDNTRLSCFGIPCSELTKAL